MNKIEKPVIVISGINMIEGGILTILRDCLNFLDKNLAGHYHIVALVHNKSFFSTENISYLEFQPKPSWVRRIYYEYFYFRKLSIKLEPLLWFSLHDTSPRVKAAIQAVYCHNATMFYKPSLNTFLLEPKLLIFSMFYKFLYKFNIQNNDYVIVQQSWIKKEFEEIFKIKNVLVAHPEAPNPVIPYNTSKVAEPVGNKAEKAFTFFYPSFPREFKNFELLCAAAEILSKNPNYNFEVIVTIAGNENKYARKLYNNYKHLSCIKWVGLLSYEEVNEIYSRTNALVFASKLETWGLPITEFLKYNRPILVPDLPYALETTSGFEKVIYFNPDDAKQLAAVMESILINTATFKNNECSTLSKTVYRGWKELFDKILN